VEDEIIVEACFDIADEVCDGDGGFVGVEFDIDSSSYGTGYLETDYGVCGEGG